MWGHIYVGWGLRIWYLAVVEVGDVQLRVQFGVRVGSEG